MSELNELKTKIFTVMKSAVKLSMNFQGKGTILENKKQDYLIRLLDNLEINSNHFNKFKESSPSFNILLSKSKKVLDDLKESKYNSKIKKYVNDVVYMFEGESLKEIAEVISFNTENSKPHKEENKIFGTGKIICSQCNKEHYYSNKDLSSINITENKIVECDCGNIILTLLKSNGSRKRVLNKINKEKEELNMSVLHELNNDL